MITTLSRPTFQRRHYETIAHVLSTARCDKQLDHDTLTEITRLLAATFEDDNANFDKERFRVAAA